MSEEKTPLSAEKALHLLEKHEREAPGALSSRTDAGDEVLRYLAQNGAVATRTAVAANPATPPDANLDLANDAAESVRTVLAGKIGKLFPGMFIAEEEHIQKLAIQTLEKLAADEAVRVRKQLAEEIKLLDCIPKQVITRLAQDAHSEVSDPVAEFSPLLTDDDLIELVAAAETNSVMNAVARRKGLTDKVTDAVIATQDTGVITTLLKNVDATIRKQTLDKLVTQAAEVAEWHGPLVMRAELSPRAIKRLSGFIATALVRTMAARNNIDEKTQAMLTKRLQERSRLAQDLRPGVDLNNEESDALVDVEMAARSGLLNDSFVSRAIEERHRETVICALSRLSKVPDKLVRTLMEANSAKAITALVWKAGLNMRTAYNIQVTVMRLSADQLMPARDGTEFPMSEEEMRWHLSYVGLEKQ